MSNVVKPTAVDPHGIQHEFCDMMRLRRTEMDISLRTLSDRIGSGSRSYLSDIEKGRYAVSVELGLAICQVLNIPVHLCMDYICCLEIHRIKTTMKKKYQEWEEYIPRNVLRDMLQDEQSLAMHELLMQPEEDMHEDYHKNI